MQTLKDKVAAQHDRFAREHRKNARPGWQIHLGYGDFLNYGYWTEDTRTGQEACETMLERLLAHIPEKRGNILDVACGMGATSRYLTKYYPEADIIGINISKDQIRHASELVPGGTFHVMPAERLGFEDESIDNIICIEAAFHFETRADFLKEAFRVLKPSGIVLLSDMFGDADHPMQAPGNRVGSIAAYRQDYEDAGFQSIDIEDATQPCVMGMTETVWNRLQTMRARGLVTEANFNHLKRGLLARRRFITYVLVSAQKP